MRAVGVDDLFEAAGSFNQRVAACGSQDSLAFTDSPQVVLEMMRQLFGGAQFHHRRNGFQRVEIAEQVVNGRALGGGVPDRLSSRSNASAAPARCSSDSAK